MEGRTPIVIYGGSLNLAGIAASLEARGGLEVVCVEPHSTAASQALHELHPAAIVFDLNDPLPNLEATLLGEQPGLMLIGVDPNRNELLVLSGHPHRAVSMADLVETIRKNGRGEEQVNGEQSTVNGELLTAYGDQNKFGNVQDE